jgi:tetratricopeptide (TPR) repeat protein
MPTLINGCGTWYLGKRRIHRVKTACRSCQSFAELESYDTTLFFVIFMIPIVPLGKKRILESCPACQRHRIVKLADWEASKSKAFGDVLDKLRANPDDRETIQMALGLATVYQDEQAFDKLADVLVGHRTDDAEIQAQLGAAYEYFSRWSDAEAAFARSLAIEPHDDTRERLAVCMIKLGRPEEAIAHLRHVFETKDPQKAWLTFWLIEGCMAKGMHEQALDLMDIRDQVFPDLAKEKSYKQQRRTAEKNKTTGKRIRSAYVHESGKTGFREGTGLGFKWPKYVAGGVFVALLAFYLGVAIYRGQSRRVYLVNGWTKPYAVSVNGQPYRLAPGERMHIDVSEGDVSVDMADNPDGPQTVAVATPFFSRPFHRPVFVLNPDRCALLAREEMIYSSYPENADNPPEFSGGKLLHEFKGVDYEFEEFPAQIQAKAGSKITKTRVGLITSPNNHLRMFLAISKLPPDGVRDYLKRLLQLDPNDNDALTVLTKTLSPPESLEFLRTRLADRPIRVEWHRIYQHMTGLAEPTKDLLPEYRKLVDETKRATDAVYLLGRIETGAAADKLYEEAANGTPPSIHARSGLSFRCLARGDFDAAVLWGTKARALNKVDLEYQRRYVLALLAAGKYAELLKVTAVNMPGDNAFFLRERVVALVATGENGAAEGEIARAMTLPVPGAAVPVDHQFAAQMRLLNEQMLAEAKRDRTKYLEISAKMTGNDPFTDNLLRGNYKAAAQAVSGAGTTPLVPLNWESHATHAGLLYLAGLKAKDGAFAEEQWKRLVEALAKGDRDGRFYAAIASGKLPFDLAAAKDATVNPSLKRVVLAALARRFPEQAKELNALSKKLDFERDEVSLCLGHVTE